MARRIGIGVQDFAKIRENDYFYIDKTDFIREWWNGGADVTLVTRPRRFGKTLNMSMLEHFFSNQYAGRGDLFEGLTIWEEDSWRRMQIRPSSWSSRFVSRKKKRRWRIR